MCAPSSSFACRTRATAVANAAVAVAKSRYPQLPAVRIGSVSGFLLFIIAEERTDLYLLGQRLQLDVDDLYPLFDAADAFGLIKVDQGDN